MLRNDAISIISNGRLALGDLAFAVAENQKNGLNATDEQKELRRRLVLTYGVLKTIDPVIVISGTQVQYVLGSYSDEKLNRILAFLKGISKQKNNPVLSKILNPISETISSGIPGPPGTGGANGYLYIGYADDAAGTGYSTAPAGKTYIAFKQSSTVISPVDVNTFSGLWRKFVGDNGVDGNDGTDGQNAYLYVGYADDATGTGYSTSPAGKVYVAFRQSTTVISPVNAATFAGLWRKFVGSAGDPGIPGTAGNTILSGLGAPDNLVGVDGDYYRDLNNTNFYGPKASGTWPAPIDLKGDQGDQGDPGTDGIDGVDGANAYVYIAYADSSDGTGFTLTYSSAKAWIAIIQSTVEIPSPVAADFAGFFTKYIGIGGDVYSTISTTSLTIGSGNQFLNVANDLAYSTGQRVVIALNGDPTNRMEGLVVNYDQITGQMTVAVDFDAGAGTFAVWDINLIGAPSGSSSGGVSRVTVSTAGGTITLGFTSTADRIFVGSATFATPKTIALATDSNAMRLEFMFEITNVAAVLTFPASFYGDTTDPTWDQTAKTWTPDHTGKYSAYATCDGTNWVLKISK